MAGYISYVLVYSVSLFLVSSVDPEVTSSLGKIVGKAFTVPFNGINFTVHQYLGIPYAEPPVAERRFQKPKLRATLDSPFYAQSFGSRCPELGRTDYNEDCLFLNVYVPDQPSDQPSGHAVMVWIHGGSFQRGTGNDYDSTMLALYGNIIAVTFNYRLGVFGFLSAADKSASGNFGLWDQRLVIEWVHKFIGDFGGDTQRVTIAGGSAGAISAMQHALTPENQGLFQRLIAQSGSTSMPTLDLERDALKTTLTLADKLKCNTSSMTDLLSCLRANSVEEIFSAVTATRTQADFLPVLDGELIKTNPKYVQKLSPNDSDFFRSLDLLSGMNVFEGNVLLPYIIDSKLIESMQPTQKEMATRYLPLAMGIIFNKNFGAELLNLVHAQYTDWTNPYDYRSVRLQITKFLGDINFRVPTIEMARLHGNSSRNFMYYFTPFPSYHVLTIPSWIDAASHGEELPFVFGAIGQLIGIGSENAWEVELATRMMRYWTNFIKSGNPNTPEPITPVWPDYRPDTGDYLTLEKSMSNDSVRQHLYAQEANFWLTVFPDLDHVAQDKQNGDCSDLTSDATTLRTNLAIIQTFMMATIVISLLLF